MVEPPSVAEEGDGRLIASDGLHQVGLFEICTGIGYTLAGLSQTVNFVFIKIGYALVSTHHLFITASHLVGIGGLTNKALCCILEFPLVFPIYWPIKVLGSVPQITQFI